MRTPARLVLQPLTGDAPDIVALRSMEGLYRVASLRSRPRVDDGSAEGVSIKPSARLRAQRFQSIEELEAAVAKELSRRAAPRSARDSENGRSVGRKLTSTAATHEGVRGRVTSGATRHPRWLDPEMAQILERSGYRHYPLGGFYVANEDCRITETQLLVTDPESLRDLISKQRGTSRSR